MNPAPVPAPPTEDDFGLRGAVRVLAESDVADWRRRLYGGAQREILSACTGLPEPESESTELEQAALARGVCCKLLYARRAVAQATGGRQGPVLTSTRTQLRVLDAQPLAALIVDRRAAVLPMHAGAAGRDWLLVREPTLVNATVLAFQGLWAQAEPGDGSLAGRDTELLRLLADGLKDDAIGRHLKISSRTVLRRLDRLMQQLGARTRFQAGVLAARHGWVD